MPQADGVSSTRERQDRVSIRSTFRPDIEGLRAVAVVAVVAFHASIPGLGGGYVGVDVFFVISGFLITWLLWREVSSTGSVRLRAFYGARARRLLPASATVGVITMVASAILLPPLQARSVMVDGIASALYVSNYRFIQQGVDYFSGAMAHSPFLHYWSLGVEEQFYLVWAPIILGVSWLARRVRRHRSPTDQADVAPLTQRPYVMVLALIVAMSFTLSFVATRIVPASAFYPLTTRAWQLALGGLIALTVGYWRRLPMRAATVAGWSGLGLIGLACVWFNPATPFPGVAALLPTIGAALVIVAGCSAPAQGCGRLLGVAPMQAIGRISYSWYLWHWPVLVLAPAALGHPLQLSAQIIAAILSAGLAWLTLRYLENPLRFAPKIRTSPRRSLVLGAGASAIAVCVGVGLLAAMPLPVGRGAPAYPVTLNVSPVPQGASIYTLDTAVQQAFSEVRAVVAASADLKAVPSNLSPPLTDAATDERSIYLDGCLRDFLEVGQPECAMGDTDSATTVALVGDSHAVMWNPALRPPADQRHWRVETLTKAGCPLLDLRMVSPVLHREYTECNQWRDEIITRLRAKSPRLVVLGLARNYGVDQRSNFRSFDSAWLDSLNHLISQLRQTGAKVLVLGPIPEPQTMVPVCLSDHLDDATACSPARTTAVNESGIAAEAAVTKAAGGHYADITDLFCTAERCPVIIGNTLVYFDRNHMTLEYSRVLAPVIGALIDRVLAHND